MRDIAQSTLDTLEQISQKASEKLNNGGVNPATSLAQINTLNDNRAILAGAGISHTLHDGYQKLSKEPALARISTVDDDGKEKTYYFSRNTIVDGIQNFASYKAPIGSLASQDVGDIFILPNGDEVTVYEKLILNPVKDGKHWDSKRTKVFFENAPNNFIGSLRSILIDIENDEFVEDDVEFDPFAKWNEENDNPDEINPRDILRGISLRDQAILDKIQDEIFRMPLKSTLMLKGPPGTGKTTTLIKRLAQKTQLPDDNSEDILAINNKRFMNNINHKDSWLMFTPTELLEHYLHEAFGKEGIASDNSKIVTWEAFRVPVSKDILRLLRAGNNGSGFILKSAVINESNMALNNLSEWFDAFDMWQKKNFVTQLLEASKLISNYTDTSIQSLGIKAKNIISKMNEENLSISFINLQEIAESFQDWIKSKRLEIKQQLDRHLRFQINNDRTFALQFLRFIEGLEQDDDSEIEEDDDVAAEDDNARTTSGGEKIAFSEFRKSIQAYCRNKAQKRTLPKDSRNAKIINWLGERGIASEKALEIGEKLILISHVSLISDPVNRYFRGLSQRYRSFRRKNLGVWYVENAIESAVISSNELDLLILSYLRSANSLARRQTVYQNIENRYWLRVGVVPQLYRNQIVVDEVTDFSPLQLASIYELAHPDIRSFFACGDFNQRLTRTGIASELQFRWAIPKIEMRKVNVGYRQSQLLAKFAHDLLVATSRKKTKNFLPFKDSHLGVAPALLEGSEDLETTANWVSCRIIEIERSIESLPSCAIFVPCEADVNPMADMLSLLLEDANIRAKACLNGDVIGRETEVRVFSIEHIKGLEFEIAFIIGLDKLSINEPGLFDKYLYVGSTRAATYLGLTCEDKLPDILNPLKDQFVDHW